MEARRLSRPGPRLMGCGERRLTVGSVENDLDARTIPEQRACSSDFTLVLSGLEAHTPRWVDRRGTHDEPSFMTSLPCGYHSEPSKSALKTLRGSQGVIASLPSFFPKLEIFTMEPHPGRWHRSAGVALTPTLAG